MAWSDNVVNALHQGDCFVSSVHRANFIQLFDEIKCYPFFTRELCKCAFTASWDQEHTGIFRQTMQELLAQGATDCSYMLEKKLPLTQGRNLNERILYDMSSDFLKYPGKTPDESCLIRLSRSWVPIGDSALAASEIIDTL
ncbi:MAG: hypothetical protein K2N46_10365 [Lachnospiraceae bacterium]|nr:hypothetical protein [Lachnospiraceae bacterium]